MLRTHRAVGASSVQLEALVVDMKNTQRERRVTCQQRFSWSGGGRCGENAEGGGAAAGGPGRRLTLQKPKLQEAGRRPDPVQPPLAGCVLTDDRAEGARPGRGGRAEHS